MTKHMQIKKKVKKINSKTTFKEILDESMLNEKEKSLMIMYYMEHKDFDYIADKLGYTRIWALKTHDKILKKIESLL